MGIRGLSHGDEELDGALSREECRSRRCGEIHFLFKLSFVDIGEAPPEYGSAWGTDTSPGDQEALSGANCG